MFVYIIFVRVLQSFEKYGVCLNVNNLRIEKKQAELVHENEWYSVD